jgi:hypothetical protein
LARNVRVKNVEQKNEPEQQGNLLEPFSLQGLLDVANDSINAGLF